MSKENDIPKSIQDIVDKAEEKARSNKEAVERLVACRGAINEQAVLHKMKFDACMDVGFSRVSSLELCKILPERK